MDEIFVLGFLINSLSLTISMSFAICMSLTIYYCQQMMKLIVHHIDFSNAHSQSKLWICKCKLIQCFF